MKSVNFLIIQFFFYQLTYSQIKTDTIFGLCNDIYSIKNSKTSYINSSLNIINIQEFEKIDLNKNIENTPEFETLAFLQSLNKIENTTIFKEYEYFIISYYSNTNNLFTETRLFEFYFNSNVKAKKCIDVLNRIKTNSIKIGDDYELNRIGVLNWYFVQDDKRVYFVHLRIPDKENPLRMILEKKIKEVLKLPN